jgi:crotonobetainyl-CoA:carnitine CoA-transferase CaiB-like acyl-CoA transferase
VLNVEQALSHPHTSHRSLIIRGQGYSGVASPVKLSRTPAALRRLPPAFGEHNEQLLSKNEAP